MIEEILVFIESSSLATALRHSTWTYPLVNAGHIFGVALLVGGVIPLDLRLLGVWRAYPMIIFVQVLRVTSALGLAIAVVCGVLLFATAATDYAGSRLFQVKMIVVLLGALNALILGRMLSPRLARNLPPRASTTVTLRIGALLSLMAWVGALVLGRLLGYF
jgi:hypothetical protein